MENQTGEKSVAVIGAGISGLTCAYELQEAGFDVTVFEKEDFVGGRMSTRMVDGFPFDIGADHLGNSYAEMQKYCKKFNLGWEKMINPKYGILRGGKIYPAYKVTNKLSQLRLAFFAWRLKNDTDFFNGSAAAHHDIENAYDFMKRVAGKDSADYLAEGITGGYQFHRTHEASKAALMSYMQSIKFEDWYLHHVEGQMISLPNAFEKRLSVKLGTSVEKVTTDNGINIKAQGEDQKFNVAVLACTANVSKEILQNQTDLQRDLLKNSKYATTISLSYKIDADALPEETNFFTPYVECKTIASYTNQKMKGEDMIRDGKSLLNAWLHEEYAESIFDLPDEEILELVKHELAKVCPWLKDEDQLEPLALYRWTHAMPKYLHGHFKRVKNFMEKGQGENNVYFSGDFLNSPWTEGALRCGQRVAQEIIKKHG